MHSTLRPRLLTAPLVALALLALTSAPAQGDILDGDQHAERFTSADTTFYDNAAPVVQTQQVLGGFELVGGPDFEDVISYSAEISSVVITITPALGDSISVSTLSGPTWTEDALGSWSATFTVPAPGEEVTGTVEVALGGSTLSSGGAFKIKKMGGPAD